MIIKPFSRWTGDHQYRVQTTHDELLLKLKEHDKQILEVKRFRNSYFNKCRLLEDLEEEIQNETLAQEEKDTPKSELNVTSIEGSEKLKQELDPVEIGDIFYSFTDLEKLLFKILKEVPMKEYKVPVMGTYQNVSTGDDVVQWIGKNLLPTSLAHSERIGQNFIDNGYLRHLGVGNKFVNSSVVNFQWKNQAFILAGLNMPRKDSLIANVSSVPYVGEYVGQWISNSNTDETPSQKLLRESEYACDLYKKKCP